MWFLRLKLILFPRQHQKKKISGHKSGLTPLSTLLYFCLLLYCPLVDFSICMYCIGVLQEVLFNCVHTVTSTNNNLLSKKTFDEFEFDLS